ncbi:MAG: hypothetical protein IJ197_08800 [Bacteroidaceae bacterium]|nr:hypothetical protein [Bacteroidaceae bacterium]
MKETVLESIVAFIFGHKYYTNIFNTRGTMRCDLSGFIFASKAEAEEHRRQMDNNHSFKFVETVTFRSRNVYRMSLIQNSPGAVLVS